MAKKRMSYEEFQRLFRYSSRDTMMLVAFDFSRVIERVPADVVDRITEKIRAEAERDERAGME